MTTLRGIWIGNAVEPGVPLISDGHMGFYRDAALDKKLCARMDLMRRKGQLEPIPFAKAERLFRPRKHRNPLGQRTATGDCTHETLEDYR